MDEEALMGGVANDEEAFSFHNPKLNKGKEVMETLENIKDSSEHY